MRSLIESTIKLRFDFFETCMIVMKGYLIDIEDPDDRNFRKKNNDLKFLYILIMSKFDGASKVFFLIDLIYTFYNLINNINKYK